MEKRRIRLFVDLDGVLVDFDKGVLKACGQTPGDLGDRRMWPILAKTPGFYARLDWMPDGRALWDFVKDKNPTILTGLPLGKWAEPQKRQWCREHLGEDIPVITCMSRNKGHAAAEVLEPGEIPVLVDDRLKVKDSWDQIAGEFILHTSAEDSIQRLRTLYEAEA